MEFTYAASTKYANYLFIYTGVRRGDMSESPAMSSGLVRCAFHSVLEEIEPLSPRADRTKEIGTDILERASADDEALTAFDEFSVRITACLRGIFQPNVTYRSWASKREKMWTDFHQIRFSEVPIIWDGFLASLQTGVDHYFIQSVTQKLFEKLLVREFAPDKTSRQSVRAYSISLGKEELNALQYACGYVPHTLLKRFQKRSGRKYDQFIQCLGQMAVYRKRAR